MNPNSDDSHSQHQHLRLVLGSILSPKRPCSVSSSSSVSGTASPAHPWSIHHHIKGVHPPDNSPATPPPSRSSASPGQANHTSNSPSPLHHPISHPDDDLVHDVSPVSPRPPLVVIGGGEHGTDLPGQRTPSRKVIATLQSKSAWDVLIHGSMV
ncbi:hypothetical protein BJ322DRAFT_1026042 [Thelephora terrestris]|uniref:Uncharacterized protein n=1 Tax=Thelephora terrestris TaxID=56493 RepID=A0A9P6LBY0_9AGAM|nr:hypothetical protein BJ322DRAFT_1026042 [Thelephora terrestris]